MTKQIVRIEADVSGTLGTADGPIDFDLTAGYHDADTIVPAVLAYLLEHGLATAKKKG